MNKLCLEFKRKTNLRLYDLKRKKLFGNQILEERRLELNERIDFCNEIKKPQK